MKSKRKEELMRTKLFLMLTDYIDDPRKIEDIGDFVSKELKRERERVIKEIIKKIKYISPTFVMVDAESFNDGRDQAIESIKGGK